MSFIMILLQLINKLPTFDGFFFCFHSCLFCVKAISAAILIRISDVEILLHYEHEQKVPHTALTFL